MSTAVELKTLFYQIEHLSSIDRAEGDILPSASTSSGPTSHLYINCLYRAYSDAEAPATLAARFRDDASRILELTAKWSTGHTFDSVCLTFYVVPKPKTNLRLYRVIVGRAKLDLIGTSELTAIADSESTGLSALRSILHS